LTSLEPVSFSRKILFYGVSTHKGNGYLLVVTTSKIFCTCLFIRSSSIRNKVPVSQGHQIASLLNWFLTFRGITVVEVV
jgi:hypothetical protein